jgi:hypothetical protein
MPSREGAKSPHGINSVKRSRTLLGRNASRDSRVDGASKRRRLPGSYLEASLQSPFIGNQVR